VAAYSRHHLTTGELSSQRALEHAWSCLEMQPIVPRILELFEASEIARACWGESRGMPRDEFEANVLELDRQAHPQADDLSPRQAEFASKAALLACQAVQHTQGPPTPEKRQLLSTLFEDDPEELSPSAAPAGRQAGDWTEARPRLQALLRGPRSEWSNTCVVEILRRPVILTPCAQDGGVGKQRDRSLVCSVHRGRQPPLRLQNRNRRPANHQTHIMNLM
jgi:hypothetical protein